MDSATFSHNKEFFRLSPIHKSRFRSCRLDYGLFEPAATKNLEIPKFLDPVFLANSCRGNLGKNLRLPLKKYAASGKIWYTIILEPPDEVKHLINLK